MKHSLKKVAALALAVGLPLASGWAQTTEVTASLLSRLQNPTPNGDDTFTNRFGALKGALAGKILGAGGGGFLMLLAPPERHAAIADAFPGHHSTHVELGAHGSEVIFDGRVIKTGTAS